MLSLLYSTVLLYYICFCFVLSCTLLIGGNKEILLLLLLFSKNIEDPYWTPSFAASDQDLHYRICSITMTFGLYVKLLNISMAYFLQFYNKVYTTLTNFSTKQLTICKVYTDVGGIKYKLYKLYKLYKYFIGIKHTKMLFAKSIYIH